MSKTFKEQILEAVKRGCLDIDELNRVCCDANFEFASEEEEAIAIAELDAISAMVDV